MTATFGDSPEMQVFNALCLIATVISTIASIISVIVIHRMNCKTGHLTLVLYMSYFQTIYDVIFFTCDVDVGNYYVLVFSFFTAVVAGMPTAIISNWMVFAAWYIVYYKKHFDVFGNLHWILWTSLLPGLANGIYYLACSFPSEDEECVTIAITYIYNNLRIASIGINFIFIVIIIYQLNLFQCFISRDDIPIQSKHVYELEMAIRTVVVRLVFYPVAQAFSRVGFTWYDLQYGTYDQSDNITTEKFICLIFYSLCSPAASVAFLIILLLTQPKAYEHCKALLQCKRGVENETESVDIIGIDRPSSSKSRKELISEATSNRELGTNPKMLRPSYYGAEPSNRNTDFDRGSILFSFQDERTNEDLYQTIENELFATANNIFISEMELTDNFPRSMSVDNPILK